MSRMNVHEQWLEQPARSDTWLAQLIANLLIDPDPARPVICRDGQAVLTLTAHDLLDALLSFVTQHRTYCECSDNSMPMSSQKLARRLRDLHAALLLHDVLLEIIPPEYGPYHYRLSCALTEEQQQAWRDAQTDTIRTLLAQLETVIHKAIQADNGMETIMRIKETVADITPLTRRRRRKSV